MSDAKEALIQPLSSSDLKPEAHVPASSLPNLADSGIVFDEHHHSSSSAVTNGFPASRLPTIRQASRSGSATLIDEVDNPVNGGIGGLGRHLHHHQVQDCRHSNNSNALGAAKSPTALVP